MKAKSLYLHCLSASLQVAEMDGRDAVEMICNTESVEKDELLLYLCKAFLTQQLQNGDMYYIWSVRLCSHTVTVAQSTLSWCIENGLHNCIVLC